MISIASWPVPSSVSASASLTLASLRAISGHVALLLAIEAETLFHDSLFLFVHSVSAAITASEIASWSAVISEATSVVVSETTSVVVSEATSWGSTIIESSRRAIVSETTIAIAAWTVTSWRHVSWWEVSGATEVTFLPHSAWWAKAFGSWSWAIVDLVSKVSSVAEVSASSVAVEFLRITTESWVMAFLAFWAISLSSGS